MSGDLARLRLVVSDVDGVLTDGRIAFDADGRRQGVFSARDGMAVQLARAAGIEIALVSGARSQAVAVRARELGIGRVYQEVERKDVVIASLLAEMQLEASEAAMLGDDLNDLPAFRAVGTSFAVADAAPEVRRAADHVTQAAGGAGALREVVESILRAQGSWERIVADLFGVPARKE